MLMTTIDLSPYIGTRVVLSDIRVGGRGKKHKGRIGTVAIHDGRRGTFDGPIYVVRKGTRAEYVAWQEQDSGESLNRLDRMASYQPNKMFFQIAMD